MNGVIIIIALFYIGFLALLFSKQRRLSQRQARIRRAAVISKGRQQPVRPFSFKTPRR